jgi:tetratricopeptide (TPR) repeat protein
LLLAPFTAIASESEVSENILVYQENRKFLEDIDRVFPFGWFQMNSSPKYEFQFKDSDLPKEVLKKMQKELKLQVEKSEIVLKEFYSQSNSLSNGVAKWVALMSKFWRCREGQELDVLKQAEHQANLLENKMNPDALSTVFFEVANSYISLKKYEEAIAAYDKALQIKPDFHEAWNNRGNALDDLGRCEEAIASHHKALQIKPDFHEAWNNRGNALGNLGRDEEAIVSYDKALQIKPDYHNSFRGRGISLTRLGQYDKALADFNRAIELEPNDLPSQINRGVLFAWMGRYAEGIEVCDGILQNNPNHVDALYSMACCYALQKNIDESIKHLTLAIDQEPDETKKRAKEDPEFDGIRDDVRFQELVSG